MNVKQKADHVRAATQTRVHRCHWPGCEVQVPPARWGCRAHWYALPISLRNQVWATYKPGQETGAFLPSPRYIEVARRVQAWIKENT